MCSGHPGFIKIVVVMTVLFVSCKTWSELSEELNVICTVEPPSYFVAQTCMLMFCG